MTRTQVCSRCGAARKGHPLPVGAKCTQTVLTDAEKKQVIDMLNQEDHNSSVNLSDNEDNSEETSAGAPGAGASGASGDSVAKQLEELKLEKARLEKERDNTRKAVKDAEEKELLLELEAYREEVRKLQNDVENEQGKLINTQTRVVEREEARKRRVPEPGLSGANPANVPITTAPGPLLQSPAPGAIVTGPPATSTPTRPPWEDNCTRQYFYPASHTRSSAQSQLKSHPR